MTKFLFSLAAVVAIAGPGAAQTITPIDQVQRGTMVTLQGTVDRITDEDEFHLSDSTGWIEVDLGDDWVMVDEGEAVTVQGFVDDDFGPREIYARSITRADGTVITLSRRDD